MGHTDFHDYEIVGGFDANTPDGPYMILFLKQQSTAIWLRQLFLDQAVSTESREFNIGRVHVRDVESISLVTRAGGSEVTFRSNRQGAAESFVLSASDMGWQELASSLEPFCMGKPGHQYWADNADGDPFIEVSFEEDPRIVSLDKY
jgi:hypothetical protein